MMDQSIYGGLWSLLDSLSLSVYSRMLPMAENNIQEIVENMLSIE
jgi:hypothetical protein